MASERFPLLQTQLSKGSLMGRKSFNSTQNFLAATSLGSTAPKRGMSLADQIMETKLRSEQAKLALLEA